MLIKLGLGLQLHRDSASSRRSRRGCMGFPTQPFIYWSWYRSIIIYLCQLDTIRCRMPYTSVTLVLWWSNDLNYVVCYSAQTTRRALATSPSSRKKSRGRCRGPDAKLKHNIPGTYWNDICIYIYQYPCEKPLKEKAPKRKTGLLQWKTVYIRSSYCYYYYYYCYSCY